MLFYAAAQTLYPALDKNFTSEFNAEYREKERNGL
jgi:hypothetical protein